MVVWRSKSTRQLCEWLAISRRIAIATRPTSLGRHKGRAGPWNLVSDYDRLHVTAMGARTHSKSSREKVRAHRKRLRKQGLRPLQIWVPDMRSPAFAAEAHRQSRAVARSPYAKEDQGFIDVISDLDGR